jgi:hypothetical protein
MTNEMRDIESRDRTVVPIDTKFEYGIWVSYSEIYTEKIYDLLVSPTQEHKRKSLPLKYEFRGEHKYISGLTEVRVHNLQVSSFYLTKVEIQWTLIHLCFLGSICNFARRTA